MAAPGMGLATAHAFAAAGAADVNDDTLRAATDELTAAGHQTPAGHGVNNAGSASEQALDVLACWAATLVREAARDSDEARTATLSKSERLQHRRVPLSMHSAAGARGRQRESGIEASATRNGSTRGRTSRRRRTTSTWATSVAGATRTGSPSTWQRCPGSSTPSLPAVPVPELFVRMARWAARH